MNRSQYLPYTAYTITPYPPRFGAPGYHNVPAMSPAPVSGLGPAAPLAYPQPTYIQQPHHHHQAQQPPPAQSAWAFNSTTGGGYAPVPGQIEDIVSPPLTALNNPPFPPGRQKHNIAGRVRGGHIPNGVHPSSLPQVQDVFAPRPPQQPMSGGPFSGPMPMPMPIAMSVSGTTSRMVGAYPPMPPQQTQQPLQQGGANSTMSTPSPVHSQGSSPSIGMPQAQAQTQRMDMVGSVGVSGIGRPSGMGFPTPSPQLPPTSNTVAMGLLQPVGGGGTGYGGQL